MIPTNRRISAAEIRRDVDILHTARLRARLHWLILAAISCLQGWLNDSPLAGFAYSGIHFISKQQAALSAGSIGRMFRMAILLAIPLIRRFFVLLNIAGNWPDFDRMNGEIYYAIAPGIYS